MQAIQQRKSANGGAIVNSLPIVAAMMGRNYGVNVVMGDFPTAATDMSNIYIPHFDPDDAEQRAATFGYVVHECGHIRCGTDIVDFQAISSGRLRHLCNILEDGRIERGIARIYPGAKAYLEGLTGFLIKQGKLPAATQEDKPGSVFGLYIMHYIACRLLGYEVARDVYEATAALMPDYFNEPFINRVNALLTAAVAAPDWYRVHEIALELLKVMEEEAVRERNAGAGNDAQQDSQQQGAGQGDTQDGSQQQQGAGQGNAQDGSQQQGAGQGDAQDGSQQQGTGQGDTQDGSQQQQGTGQGNAQDGSQQQQGTGQGNAQDGSQQQGGNVSEALESLASVLQGVSDKGDAVAPFIKGNSHNRSQEAAVIRPVKERKLTPSKGGKINSAVKGYANTLGNHLQDLLNVETMVRTGYARKGRRVEAKRLCRISQGDLRVFRTKNIREDEDTALFLALDMSSSMDDVQTDAVKITLALSLAISQLPGVDLKVCAFNERNPVLRLKEFGEPVEECTGRFDEVCAEGGTPMVPVVSNAALNLMSRPEPRKVFWMITDGCDNGVSDPLCGILPELGIEVAGIFLGEKRPHDPSYTEYVQNAMTNKFGRSWQWVENMHQLKSHLVKLAQDSLAGRQ